MHAWPSGQAVTISMIEGTHYTRLEWMLNCWVLGVVLGWKLRPKRNTALKEIPFLKKASIWNFSPKLWFCYFLFLGVQFLKAGTQLYNIAICQQLSVPRLQHCSEALISTDLSDSIFNLLVFSRMYFRKIMFRNIVTIRDFFTFEFTDLENLKRRFFSVSIVTNDWWSKLQSNQFTNLCCLNF